MRVCVVVLLASCRVGFEPLPDADVGIEGCPESYTVTIASSRSRYRITSTDLSFDEHHRACAADAPGATHLVTLNSVTEEIELAPEIAAVPMPARGRFYVGAVQPPGQTVVDAGWLGFDGAPVPADVWAAGEPDDLDDIEDSTEQRATVNDTRFMLDVSGPVPYGAVCECDGVAIAPEVLVLAPL